MEKPWKFEIGVKEKTWIFLFLPIFANFCNERGKKRGFRGISMEKSWKIVEIWNTSQVKNMPIFRFLGKNSRFWESLTKKKKIKGHFQGKTWIFQEFFVRFGNVDENPRFGPKNVDGLFFLVATLINPLSQMSKYDCGL